MSGDLYNIKKIKIGDIKSPRDISWNKRQLNMKDYIIQNHTDEKLYIKISKDNEIIDGRHRYNILLDEFGNEYEIYVQQMKIDKLTFSIFMYIFLPILLPIGFVLACFQKLKNLW